MSRPEGYLNTVKRAPSHAYIHIPYCIRKCPYCDFTSYPIREAAVSPELYERLILREAAFVLEQSLKKAAFLPPLETVYFGGGTPSAVSPSLILKMTGLLREYAGIKEEAEITLEANPGTVSSEAFKIYKEAGINRLSFGLQSSDDEMLQKIGRIHSREDFLKGYKAAREAGFENINVDLMLALPGQSPEDLCREMDFILGLDPRPEHVSVYSLIIEPGTPFAALYESGRPPLPDDDCERRMYHYVRDRLRSEGLIPYEISNQAKAGFESRHNIAYWEGKSYYGFGAGASSYLFSARRKNPDSLLAYKEQVLHNEAAPLEEIIDLDEAVKEFFIFRLRKSEGFSEAEFNAMFGRGFSSEEKNTLRHFCGEGLLLCEKGRIFLSRKGLDFSDAVARAFL